ncbi:MAG TPA: hypothetical protein VN823_26245 [Stellaceae bacterium]|nr:hypothetical protein [Stellaceae bacterium]
MFMVSRRDDPARPLLLVTAEGADEAVVKIEEQEEVGTLYERGYRDSPEGYTASEADEALLLQWKASVEDGISDGVLDAGSRASEWVIFLREPEFDPDLEEIGAADEC